MGEKHFVSVTDLGATWTDNKNKFKITLDKFSLKLAISFFHANGCFQFWQFVLLICLFEKSLIFLWVLTQQFLF